jgi:ribose 5-phosphate isomerase B
MKIAIGSDHRGFQHKAEIIADLQAAGHELIDMGCFDTQSADYPDPAFAVGRAVAAGDAQRGVLICGSGIGVSIAANKVKGVRAALCWTPAMAATTRQHNNSNVICFSADNTDIAGAVEMTGIWLASEFEGGRHARRVDKIIDFENEQR